MFTWGTPITTIALFTFLLHLGIETKTWVRVAGALQKGLGHVTFTSKQTPCDPAGL